MILKDKNIIITGGSSGIGRQIAVSCINQGAKILLLGRNEREMEITCLLCKEQSRIDFLSHDLSISRLPEHKIIEDFVTGGLHGLVHSAGISITSPFRTHDIIFLIDSLQVNLISGLELIKKFESDFDSGSSIVFISSVMGIVGQAAKLSYCASKGAIDAAVRSMAIEYATRNIRINSILPGVVQTPLSNSLLAKLPEENLHELIGKHPLGIGEPEEIANACVFLLSDQSKWITGINLLVDGGYTAQ